MVVVFHLHEAKFLTLGFAQALLFRSTILKPDLNERHGHRWRAVHRSLVVTHLHLCLGQMERGREFGPFGNGQVLLVAELPLERQ